MEEIFKDMNRYRLEVRQKCLIQVFIGCSVAVLFSLLIGQLNFMYFGIVLSLIFIIVKHQQDYRKKVKTLLFVKINARYSNVKLTAEGYDKEVIKSSGMIKNGDSYTSQNLIKIRENNMVTKSALVRVTESRGSGKNRRTVTLFAGHYLVFSYENRLKGRHHIKESSTSFFEGKGDFRFEDQELEMFKLLTPQVIELLKTIEINHPGKIQFCFFYNELHVSIYNNDTNTKLSIFSELDHQYVESITQEIQFLQSFTKEMAVINEKFMTIKELA